MLSIPPSARVAIGTVQVAGKTYDVFASPEWARYLQALTSQTNENAAGLNATRAQAAFLADAGETPDVFPGPQGPAGGRGDPGLALFMLQDYPDEQPMLVPPVIDGAFVPTAAKDAAGGVPALTLFKLNLKNAAGTIVSWFTTAATAARTWNMPDKDGTVALTNDFASPPAIGSTAPAAGNFTSLAASAAFGCNGKSAQGAATVNAAATDLASVIALCNQLRAALIANGIAA